MHAHIEPRVSRRGYRPRPIPAGHTIFTTPCLHADLAREDTGR